MPPKVTPGNVIFYADCRPPLRAGDYTLEVGQELLKDGAHVDAQGPPLPSARRHKFSVVGPRFTLNPDEIHGVFPPANSQGHFESRLPMVVLRRRTLPWERRLEGAPDAAGAAPPWMALLLFEEDEVTLLDPPGCTVGAIVDGDAAAGVEPITLPNLSAADRAEKCLGVQVERETFREIAPMGVELSLLTHVRQVSTEDKELLGMDEDGWFAVVVGNRLPEGGKKYVACLVSLEGHWQHLPTAEQAAEFTADDFNAGNRGVFVDPGLVVGGGTLTTSARVSSDGMLSPLVFDRATRDWSVAAVFPSYRFVTLARWSFTCVGGGDFEQLMRELPRRGGVAMLGMTQHDAVAAGVNPRTDYRVALDSGHVPLAHTTREGEHVTAWYRGPLVPAGVTRDRDAGPYHTADQARRVDPLTGLESLGYAAAFEVGRLLALSDPRFALELLRWRRDGSGRVAQAVNHHQLLVNLPEFVAERIPLPDEYHRLFTLRLIEDIGPRVESGALLGPLGDPTGLASISRLIPGLDPAAVARATQFDEGLVSGLLGATLEGSVSVLDSVSVGPSALESDFDRLSARASEHEFGYLNIVRDDFERGGQF